MSLTADQAKIIADYTLADHEHERATTKRVIAAVPAGQEHYTPGGKSMKSLDLAWHIASSEWFFLDGVCKGQFSPGESKRPETIRNAQDVLVWYDANVPPLMARAKGLSPNQLSQVIDFFGMMQLPAVVFLTLMVKHSAHHRGQLSVYLRPMGAKVPGIYGPSGDSQ
jgi:uncharacterized damage-inducible protein DinB